MPSLAEQVGDAAGLLGLFLALVTLFTTEQARRLAEERARQGGSRPERVRAVFWLSLGLAAVTLGSIAFLAPLVADVVGAYGDDEWTPVLGVFLLTDVLLVALFVWQALIVWRTRPGSSAPAPN